MRFFFYLQKRFLKFWGKQYNVFGQYQLKGCKSQFLGWKKKLKKKKKKLPQNLILKFKDNNTKPYSKVKDNKYNSFRKKKLILQKLISIYCKIQTKVSEEKLFCFLFPYCFEHFLFLSFSLQLSSSVGRNNGTRVV